MTEQSATPSGPDHYLAEAIAHLGLAEFPRYFSALLRSLCEFDNLIIIAYAGEQRPVVLHREFTDPIVYLPMDSLYLGGAYLLDPFYHEHRRGHVRGLCRLKDVAPDHFRRTQYYKTYYEQTTLHDEVAIFAPLPDAMTLTACLGRDRSSQGPFSRTSLKLLQQWQASLSALLSRHWHYVPIARQRAPATAVSLAERLGQALENSSGIHLSPRQAEVALLILRGHSSVSIGLHLDVSPQTVKVFRRQLYQRLNIATQAELFALLMPLLSTVSEG